jgi:hypothetical protein
VVAEHALRDRWANIKTLSCITEQYLHYCILCMAITPHASDSLMRAVSFTGLEFDGNIHLSSRFYYKYS